MAETSLSKLQNKIISQEKTIIRLRDALEDQKINNKSLKKKINYIENNMEKRIKQEIANFCAELIEQNRKLEEENIKLKEDLAKIRKVLNNDSNNSGLPTSKTPINKEKRIPNSREKSELSKGGQPGHKKHKLNRFNDNEITDTYIHELNNEKCTCGGKFKVIGKREKDEFDVKVRVYKIRHEFLEYECVCCHKEIKVPVPDNLQEENQYGSNVQALVVSLVNEGCVSFHRTKELISGFTNNEINMSEGYIAKLQKRCYDKLEIFSNEMFKEIIRQTVLNWDDTVISINGNRGNLRFYGTDKLAYYTAQEKKDKKGLDNDGILPNLSKETVVVHDHNIINYNDDYEFTNAECCVHLGRDLESLDERLPREWLKEMKKLLYETNKRRNDYIGKNIMEFDQNFTDKVEEEYDRIIKEAKEINAKDYNKYYGGEEKTLINRLITYKDNYLLWVIRFDVPFSNNLSERSLRSSKTKMKVSGQFANITNAGYYARIKSYIETCKRNEINVHIAIARLLENNPYTISEILKEG